MIHENINIIINKIANSRDLRAKMRGVAGGAGAQPCTVPALPTLVAAVKTQDMAAIALAAQAGIRHFGENRVQEAANHWGSPEGAALRRQYPGIMLHLIGPLQTNKVRVALGLFDVIESVDRIALVDAIAVEQQKQGRRPACYLQVNTGEEPQKSGVLPRDLGGVLAHARGRELDVRGLMCIPPADVARQGGAGPHFALLSKLAARYDLPELSMGMSADYELAILLGATSVRVGSAIFGNRQA